MVTACVALVATACVRSPATAEAGGSGRLLDKGMPLAGADVTLVSWNGATTHGRTDAQGRFAIAVDHSGRWVSPLSNPGRHLVEVSVTVDGAERAHWNFERLYLGTNDFDFGTIDIANGPPPAPEQR